MFTTEMIEPVVACKNKGKKKETRVSGAAVVAKPPGPLHRWLCYVASTSASTGSDAGVPRASTGEVTPLFYESCQFNSLRVTDRRGSVGAVAPCLELGVGYHLEP